MTDTSKDSFNEPKKTKRHHINVAELRRGLGQRKTIEVYHLLEPVEVVSSRSLEEAVVGSVVIESIEMGVAIYGSVTFAWEGDCRRCLIDVSGSSTIEIDEIFQAETPPDSEIIELENNTVDLVPIVRDAVSLAIPLAPLCGPDCLGPDPDRYPTKSAEELDDERSAERDQDPRWAALDGLKFD